MVKYPGKAVPFASGLDDPEGMIFAISSLL
jgi:hypothetical protein